MNRALGALPPKAFAYISVSSFDEMPFSHLHRSRLDGAYLNWRTNSSRWCLTTRYSFTSSLLTSLMTSAGGRRK